MKENDNNKLYKSLLAVKKEMTAVKKDANNPYFQSKYADLNSVLQMIEPLLIKYNLILLQPTKTTLEGSNLVTSIIAHAETGDNIESTVTLVGNTDMQKLGSAITYARRYTLVSLLGIQTEDDDAESAVGRGNNSNNKTTPKPNNSTGGFGKK